MIKAASFLFFLSLSGSSAVAAKQPDGYEGTDAGCLIYSAGTIKIGMHFTFPYNRVTTSDGVAVNDWKGRIEPKVGGAIVLKVKNPDFTGEESGHVVVRCLPPGVYRIGNYAFHGFLPGVGSYEWSPAHDTAFTFHIRSSQATYIGSFMRAPGTPLLPTLGAAGFFVVANRAERDLPIAKGRLRADMKIVSEVTDVSVFNNPTLRISEP